ncbi:MAG: hypothetical protein HY078_02870 [Elusimicrobia bacterium]|nr:hypothetical protein [Elusimicrobiota bacterium]
MPINPKDEKDPVKKMVYLVEHDLRGPLAVMKNSVFIVNAKLDALGVKDEKVLKYMKAMDEEITRMNQMIMDIASFGRGAARQA